MLLNLLLLILCAVHVNYLYIRNIVSCNSEIMCVHPVIKGYDELNQEILECKYTYDVNDNCDYIELDSGLRTNDDDLVILNLNIRGLYSKIGKLVYLIDHVLSDKTPDIITLSETWMTNHTPKFTIPGYKLYHSNRVGRRGGGVGVLVKQNLSSRELLEIPTQINGIEACSVEIKTNKGPLGILSLYRPPNTSPMNFAKNFETIVKKAKKHCMELVIGLDHNLDFLKATKHNPTNDFIEKILDLNLLPSITRPTRITKSSATLIDNIIVDHKHCEYLDSFVVIDDISDHLPCVVVLKEMLMNKRSKRKITSRDLREKCLTRLQQSLRDIKWNTDSQTVDQLAESFHELLTKKIDQFCPVRTRQINYSSMRKEPWLTTGIMSSIAKAKKLYKNSLMKNVTNKERNKYIQYNRTLQRTKRASKKQYYYDKCTEFKNNTRKLWKTINKLCNTQNDKSSVVEILKVNGKRCCNSQSIANEFGSYFSTVGETFANKIPTSNKSINDYLKAMQSCQRSIFLMPCTITETKELISKLPNKGSSGTDNISNILLKKLKDEIANPLTVIINASIEQGSFPDLMKCTLVVPLYKAKAKDEVTNYRPISLLMTMSKIIEKVMYKRVYGYLNLSGQLYDSQYGFRNNHSCEHAIGELLGNIVKNQQLGKNTVSIMLDLSKAFDTLQHSVIFKKLELYGLRGNCLAWFKSYLSNRSMCVKCTDQTGKKVLSDTFPLNYGTPQGSCMGPLIFLIFCNDLHHHLQFMESIQFADDTTLYMGHKSLKYLKFCLETDMVTIRDWFRANKLTLNIEKTIILWFKNKNPNNQILETVDIDGLQLECATFAKFLGLWIDSILNWKEHVRRLILKLSSRKSLLCRGKTSSRCMQKSIVLCPDT